MASTTTNALLAELLVSNAHVSRLAETAAAGQVMLLAGSADDPDSFDKDGGKTGPLGYYPVTDVNEQTFYLPCNARRDLDAAAGVEAAVVAVDSRIDPLAAATDYRYPSRAAASTVAIPAVAQQVTITGWTVFADALRSVWRRVAAQPAHPACWRSLDRFLPNGAVDEANGGWWELAEDHVRPEWVADPADPQAGLEAALASGTALGVSMRLLARAYPATRTLLQLLSKAGVAIEGEGINLTAIVQADKVWSRVLRFEGDKTYQQTSQRGSATMRSAVVTGVADTSRLAVGMPVSGRFIPAGAVIKSIDSANQLTLSKAVFTTGAISMVFRPLVDNRPSLTLKNLTLGRANAAGYTGAVGPQTLSIDYFRGVTLENVGVSGSIGWGMTAAFCEDVTIRGARVRDSVPGKTGTDGINLYKCYNVTIEGCVVSGVGDDPISVGSYDDAYPLDNFLIHDCLVFNTTGSIKVYGGARNGRIHHCWAFSTVTGCVGLWNDRPSAQAIGMYNIRVDNCHAVNCGTTGSLGAFNVYSSVPGGTAVPTDPLTYMEDISFVSCTADGGQYGVSIYTNADVARTKRARRITIRDCDFQNQTNDGINVLGIDDWLRISGGSIRTTAGRPVFIKDMSDNFRLTIGGDLEIDDFLSNLGVTVGIAGIFASTAKNLRLDCRRVKVSNNRRGTLIQPVRTEAVTLHPLSYLDVDADNTFDAQSQLGGWRGTGTKRVTGGAARVTSTGFTYQTGQAYTYPLAASGAVPGDNVKEGGTFGTLYAADGASAVTATTTAGSAQVQLSDATNVFPGCYITIAGVTITTGTNVTSTRLPVLAVNGLVATLPLPANEAVAGGAVGYYAPTLIALPAVIPTSGGGSVAFPMDGADYLIDLDSLVGQGHEVRFTTPIPKLLSAAGNGVKIRFSDAFLIDDLVWSVIRYETPNQRWRRAKSIDFSRYTGTLPTDGNGVDFVAESATLKAQRTYDPNRQIGPILGTFTMTCPKYGIAHAPVELVYKPPAGFDFYVMLTLRAVKSGGN